MPKKSNANSKQNPPADPTAEPAAEPAPTEPTSTIPDGTAEQPDLTQILFDTVQSMSGGVGGTAVKSDAFKRVRQQSPDVHFTKTALDKAWKALVANGCLRAVTGGTAVLNRATLSEPPLTQQSCPAASLSARLAAGGICAVCAVALPLSANPVFVFLDLGLAVFVYCVLLGKATGFLARVARVARSEGRPSAPPATVPASTPSKATAPAQPDEFDVRLPTGEDIRLPRGLCVENACTFSTDLVVREMCTDCGHHDAATCKFIHLVSIMVGGRSVPVAELLMNVGLLCHLMTRPHDDNKFGFCTKETSCPNPLLCSRLHFAGDVRRGAPDCLPAEEHDIIELGRVIEATKAVEAYCYKLARHAGLEYKAPKKLLQLCKEVRQRLWWKDRNDLWTLFALRNEIVHIHSVPNNTDYGRRKRFWARIDKSFFGTLLPRDRKFEAARDSGVVGTYCRRLEHQLRLLATRRRWGTASEREGQSLGDLVDTAQKEGFLSAANHGGTLLLAQLRLLTGLRNNALHAHPLGAAPPTCPLAFKHLCEACMKGLNVLAARAP